MPWSAASLESYLAKGAQSESRDGAVQELANHQVEKLSSKMELFHWSSFLTNRSATQTSVPTSVTHLIDLPYLLLSAHFQMAMSSAAEHPGRNGVEEA